MKRWRKLTEAASVLYGRRFDNKWIAALHDVPLAMTDSVPLVRVGDVASGKASTYYTGPIPSPPLKYIVKQGDVVVSMSGNFNVNRWKDRDGLLDLRVMRVRGKTNSSSTGYLYHYLKPVFQRIEDETEGRRTKNLSAKQVNEIEVFLPSYKEQDEISTTLDVFSQTVDNFFRQAELRRIQLEYFRDRLFDLEGKTDVRMTTLENICLNVFGGGTPSTTHPEYYQGTIPWLRTQEIDWNEITDTEVKITSEAIQHSQAELIPAGCVIVAMYGCTAGKAAINRIPLCTNQACCNLQVNPKMALPEYVFHYLASQQANLKALGEGPRGNLNATKIKTYPIPIPSLEEQRRIVAAIDTFNKYIANLERQVTLRTQQYEYYRNAIIKKQDKIF